MQQFAIRYVSSISEKDSELFPYATSDLLEPSVLRHVLNKQAEQLGGVSLEVASTMFAKRYSVLIAGMFATYTLYDIPLSTNPKDIRIRLERSGVMAYEVRRHPKNLEHTDLKFSAYVQNVTVHMELIVQAVADTSGVPVKVLRSLILHQVHTLYAWLQWEAANPEFRPQGRQSKIAAERFALNQSKAAVGFAAKFRLIQHYPNERPLLMRPYCCQAYRTDDHGYCETCPKPSRSV